MGKENYSKMIVAGPVKTASLDHEDLFLHQHVQNKLFIILDIKFFGIDSREQIQRALRFYTGDSVYLIEHLPSDVALFVKATTRGSKLVDALVTAKSGLNRVLCGHICTQAG